MSAELMKLNFVRRPSIVHLCCNFWKQLFFRSFTNIFIFFIFINIGPYGSKNAATPTITAKSFQTFPEFSSQWSSQNYVWFFFFFFLSFWFLALCDLERLKSRSPRFQSIISHQGTELGHVLLLHIKRKAYMPGPLIWLHLTRVTLKGPCQGHSDLEKLMSHKGAEIIRHYVTIKH